MIVWGAIIGGVLLSMAYPCGGFCAVTVAITGGLVGGLVGGFIQFKAGGGR